MKRVLPFLFAVLFSHFICAQVEEPRSMLDIGVAGGVNINRMEIQPIIRQFFHPGFNGGLNIRYTSERYFKMICAAQIEVNFVQRGLKEDFDDKSKNSYMRTLNYIEIPFFAHLAFGKERRGFQFYLNLGPQIGYMLGSNEKYIGEWSIIHRPLSIQPIYGKPVDNKFEYGIAGGLGVEYKSKIGNFFIEGRYYYGLSDIFHNSKSDDFARSANTSIYARLGYSVTIFNK